MRVVMLASEAHPLAKTGGLGDVLAALPPALAAAGVDVTVCLPAYRGILRRLDATGTPLRSVLSTTQYFSALRRRRSARSPRTS